MKKMTNSKSVEKSGVILPRFLLYVLAAQVMACITLVLDIPIARQVAGFLYLTFIPGIILLKVFRLEKSDLTEMILFSVGLSVTFLMSIGLLINELGPLVLISKPLSVEPLALIINIVVLLMCILECVKNRKDFIAKVSVGFGSSRLAMLYFLLLVLLPFLSVLGAMLVNALQDSFFLLSIIMLISILFFLGAISPRFSLYYPLAIFLIALALLFQTSLISNYIHGSDINIELHIFEVTKDLSYWNPNLFRAVADYQRWSDLANLGSMLSISVLPTIYSNILNIEETWVLKIVYPLIFSFLPLGLYQLYRTQWGKKAAFISSFFFVSNFVFLE